MSKYQVILTKDTKRNKNYFYSFVESDDITQGNIELEELPPYSDTNKARSCYLSARSWVFDADKYAEIVKTAEEERVNALTTITASEKLQLLAEAITVDTAPKENGVVLPKKTGYIWTKKVYFSNGVPAIAWELKPDPLYKPVNDGTDYLRAINWAEGNAVVAGLWYNVGDGLIWQAKKDGVPTSAEDKDFFDIP